MPTIELTSREAEALSNALDNTEIEQDSKHQDIMSYAEEKA